MRIKLGSQVRNLASGRIVTRCRRCKKTAVHMHMPIQGVKHCDRCGGRNQIERKD